MYLYICFRKYRCTPPVAIVATVILNYILQFSVVLACFIYYFLWREIKKVLRQGTTDEQKNKKLEQGNLINF